MILSYLNKKEEKEILQKSNLVIKSDDNPNNNKLIFGENFDSLKSLLYDYNTSVDLIYIDPPFSTNSTFTIGEERTSTVSYSNSDDVAYKDNLKGSDYLEFLRERLIILRELLSDKGSIYLHIDYKIGHYVKIIMDEVFGSKNFKNDITRIKCNPKNFYRKSYGNIKDMILFYSKSNNYIWNEPKIELKQAEIDRHFKKTDKNGRKYTTIPIHAPGEAKNEDTLFMGLRAPKGRHWRSNVKVLEELNEKGLIEWSKNNVPRKIIYADEQVEKGKKLQDIWDEFKDPQYPLYPTQKNEKLLDLIISTSSNGNSTILDCFAGSGTTLIESQILGRNWIGIDESRKSIEVIKKRLSPSQTDMFSNYQYFELHESVKKKISNG